MSFYSVFRRFGDAFRRVGLRAHNGVGFVVASENEGPPPDQQVTYQEDITTDFLNPERGWYVETTDIRTETMTFNPAYRLTMLFVRLDAFRSAAISTAMLNSLRNALAAYRSAGHKCVLRFSYNRPNQDGVIYDAPFSRVMQHIGQLAPILADYEDILYVHQAGFIGKWAEWHGSTNNLVSGSDSNGRWRDQILKALLDATPATRMVQNRYPWVVALYADRFFPTRHPNVTNRFNQADQQRLGLYNDCWTQGPGNVGTYTDWDGTVFAEDRETAEKVSIVTGWGGETCDDSLNSANTCSAMLADAALVNIDYLNREYSTPLLNRWISDGCFNELSRRMGYRLVLREANLPSTVAPNGQMTATFEIKNAGFGKVFNPRPMDLVFVGPGGPFTARMTSDARRDLPLAGQTVTPSFTFTAPPLVVGQQYAVHLRLPDPSANLQADNRYAIRLANIGLWDSSTGRHNLGITVTAAY